MIRQEVFNEETGDLVWWIETEDDGTFIRSKDTEDDE